MASVTVFDFVKSITETKIDIYEGNEAVYNPFVINTALSFNLDCIFIVHELSKYPNMPHYCQYMYLMNAVDKKRRYGKWIKKDKISENIALIKEAYGYSDEKAVTALSILSDKQLMELKQLMDKGGQR